MKTLATIQPDFSVLLGQEPTANDTHVAYREAVKALILNDQNEVALTTRPGFNNGKGGYSLPGGGIEENESPEEGLVREIKEEVGCSIRDIIPLGIIYEFSVGKTGDRRLQKTFCFLARTDGVIGEKALEHGEQDMEIVWLPIGEAEKEFDSSLPSVAKSRALLVFEEALKIL